MGPKFSTPVFHSFLPVHLAIHHLRATPRASQQSTKQDEKIRDPFSDRTNRRRIPLAGDFYATRRIERQDTVHVDQDFSRSSHNV